MPASRHSHFDESQTPGLIWAYEFTNGFGHATPAAPTGAADSFRWLHFNLSDQRGCRAIAAMEGVPGFARELLLSRDEHPRAFVDGGFACGVVRDFIRNFFEGNDDMQLGALHFAMGQSLVITGRFHPLRCGDVVHDRIKAGASVTDTASALDLLFTALVRTSAELLSGLAHQVEGIEDAVLEDATSFNPRIITILRRRTVQMARQASSLKLILNDLAMEEDLPEAMEQAINRQMQRVASLEADVADMQSQTRLLREEIDLQTARRTNQNLYILSIMTALMLPATFVTGLFGMNTGSMWLSRSALGTLWATGIALGSAFAVYILLRLAGFFRHEGD